MISCDDYLANPAEGEQHLAGCERCRKVMEELDALDAELQSAGVVLKSPAIPEVASLPVAPWEGARERSWGAVLAAAVFVSLLSASGFLLLGISPLEGFLAALTSSFPGSGIPRVLETISALLSRAPMRFHLLVLAGFVVVNVLFVLLLRRPTKGYDATH